MKIATIFIFFAIFITIEGCGGGASSDNNATATPAISVPNPVVIPAQTPVVSKWTIPDMTIMSMAVDQTTGDVYVAGSTKYTPTDAVVAKFSVDGNVLWEKKMGGPLWDFASEIRVFNNRVFVLWDNRDAFGIGVSGGNQLSSFDSYGNDILTFQGLEYIANGMFVDADYIYFHWVRMSYDGTNMTDTPNLGPGWGNTSISGVAVHGGMVYYTGDSVAPFSINSLDRRRFIMKSDKAGNVIYVFNWKQDISLPNAGQGLHVNDFGIYTTNPGPTISRHNFNGNLLWEQRRNDACYGSFSYIVADSNGSAYAMGRSFLGCGLTKVDINGVLIWQTNVVGRSLAIFGDVVFIVNKDGAIERYSSITGERL
ncbi:hypothetical protein HY249_02870 [Candidatus Azambacteria bacterium]|nr:hypothetical protein [Candidatus Azambacteria bacterium]